MANHVTVSIPQARIESFRSTMRGEVLGPSNPSYDATRVVWNGMIDRRPALIARCANAASRLEFRLRLKVPFATVGIGPLGPIRRREGEP